MNSIHVSKLLFTIAGIKDGIVELGKMQKAHNLIITLEVEEILNLLESECGIKCEPLKCRYITQEVINEKTD